MQMFSAWEDRFVSNPKPVIVVEWVNCYCKQAMKPGQTHTTCTVPEPIAPTPIQEETRESPSLARNDEMGISPRTSSSAERPQESGEIGPVRSTPAKQGKNFGHVKIR